MTDWNEKIIMEVENYHLAGIFVKNFGKAKK